MTVTTATLSRRLARLEDQRRQATNAGVPTHGITLPTPPPEEARRIVRWFVDIGGFVFMGQDHRLWPLRVHLFGEDEPEEEGRDDGMD